MSATRRFVSAGLLTVALALPLSLGAPAAQAGVKIGAVLSATGLAEYLGAPEKRTLELWVEAINAAGGVDGETIDLIVHDDGGEPEVARALATRLVEQDKVAAVIGGTTTATTLAMIPVLEAAQVPFVSLAGAVQIVEPVRKWVFKTPHTDRMACEKIFADLKRRKLTTIAIVSGTDAFGRSMREQCVKVAPAGGITVAHEETYGPADTDVTAQLSAVKARRGLQAVVVAGHGQGPAIVTRSYRQLGIGLPLYQSHGVASKQFIALAGPSAEGVRLPAAALLVPDKLAEGDPQKAVVQAYARTWQQKTGQPVSAFGGHAYDGLMLVVEAAKRAGGFDRARLRDELERTRGHVGTGGVVTMSPTDHTGLDLSALRMLEIRKGDWVLVSEQGS
ncbi:ABC transporter substrate-binding protein [Rhodoplanes sp. TEM]|uniref:ABC transporter substrate-binding protein n=1 Tax=Rhodoplanes tepidamans TaxID=200616 RepID=A0ABT5J5G3_RHOTP|nr:MULTISPECIES: ABC transporter substrate-binding protein [Rhodoplanes]MDC7784884.1 ABC transporter substrate-binding protein [Rhodoplanes tepidamans]MDC7986070.1 ABC transporter substrate-binding protein [Rhodoplanes sp. TEM]MDQ0353887.1 branched-chain amino acid transport system substrate-binding protein [Rhodoplanes tepidamans]